MKEKNTIVICMGSSCFLRGNRENLELIKKYIEQNNLIAEVELIGELCANKCSKGPNIFINGELYSEITPNALDNILEEALKTKDN